MEQLKACYTAYVEAAKKVDKKKNFLDGIFGFGSSAKEHPCHQEFYDGVAAWCDDFVQTNPTPEQAEEAVRYILQIAEEHRNTLTYWYMYAAHGLARPLIRLVSPGFAAEMGKWYNSHYSRRDRMPVQQEVFDLLKKQAKA